MTSEEFESLLALLNPDREQAAKRYESIRRRLIRFFEWRGCGIPEELTDKTFDRVARKAAQEGFQLENPDPYSYIAGCARFVWLEHRRHPREEPADGRELDLPDPVLPDPEPDPRLPCFERCLADLGAQERQLLLAFHAGEDRIPSRQRLSKSLGCSPNALRIRVHRSRQKLLDCLARCPGPDGE